MKVQVKGGGDCMPLTTSSFPLYKNAGSWGSRIEICHGAVPSKPHLEAATGGKRRGAKPNRRKVHVKLPQIAGLST